MSEGSGSARSGGYRNLVFAFIFVAISAVMGFHAYDTMKIGTLENMGPGFFPLMLSFLLAFLAILVGFTALPVDAESLRIAKPKAVILVIASPLIFALTIRNLGLVLAVFITVFVVSFASRHATVKQSLILSAGFTVFCVALFGYLLNLPIPLWGTVFEH
jgi:hypothetical protein